MFHPAPALMQCHLKDTNTLLKSHHWIKQGTLFLFGFDGLKSHSCWDNKYFSAINIKMQNMDKNHGALISYGQHDKKQWESETDKLQICK